jgi:tRNA U34 5-methylaminomethyl-2-thiouridine-forming methyltransferase MnmC
MIASKGLSSPSALSPVETQDHSWTCYSPAYQETFHSRAGAQEECELVFLRPAQLRKRWAEQAYLFKILEVGFGLGLNWQTFCKVWQAAATQDQVGPKTEYHALEKDQALIQSTFQNLKLAPTWQAAGYWTQTWSVGNHHLQLYLWPGDARLIVPQIRAYLMPLDIIWQDAFSPRHNPELWTWQWFAELKSVAGQQAGLCTYSAATPVRLALQKAGFIVHALPGSATKKSFTYACLSGPPDAHLAAKLAHSPLQALDDQDRSLLND